MIKQIHTPVQAKEALDHETVHDETDATIDSDWESFYEFLGVLPLLPEGEGDIFKELHQDLPYEAPTLDWECLRQATERIRNQTRFRLLEEYSTEGTPLFFDDEWGEFLRLAIWRKTGPPMDSETTGYLRDVAEVLDEHPSLEWSPETSTESYIELAHFERGCFKVWIESPRDVLQYLEEESFEFRDLEEVASDE
jgi:hypothetical protein